MIGLVEMPRAWAMIRGMGRSAGVDLVAAVVEGWMTRGELADLVSVCETCDQAAACTLWLATQIRAEGPPDFCHNRSALSALQG